MKHFLFAIISASALGLVASIVAPTTSSAATPQVVTVAASATTLFSPNEITVHVGQPVELRLVGQSGVHGIQSGELGIPNTTITPGNVATVTFTPTKIGTYTVHCTIPCGMDHAKMTLVIKVV
jgi:cytochrome c oxidase subunit 2